MTKNSSREFWDHEKRKGLYRRSGLQYPYPRKRLTRMVLGQRPMIRPFTCKTRLSLTVSHRLKPLKCKMRCHRMPGQTESHQQKRSTGRPVSLSMTNRAFAAMTRNCRTSDLKSVIWKMISCIDDRPARSPHDKCGLLLFLSERMADNRTRGRSKLSGSALPSGRIVPC